MNPITTDEKGTVCVYYVSVEEQLMVQLSRMRWIGGEHAKVSLLIAA